jgi:Ca2+/Na+ antiporter
LDYSSWLQKVFPQLNETSKETIDSYVEKAKSDTELFRSFFKVMVGLTFIPFSIYLYASGIQSLFNPLHWLLISAFMFVTGFIELFCEQKLIKRHLKKLVMLKHT